MKKLLLFVIACTLGLFGAVNAQETVLIGDEANAVINSSIPFDLWSANNISQQVYTADEINHDAGAINSLAVRFWGVGGNQDCVITDAPGSGSFPRKVAIYINNTDLTFMPQVGQNVPTGQVANFDGEVTFVTGEWTEFTFDNPFQYEGGNILVTMYDYSNGTSGNDYYYFYVSELGENTKKTAFKNSYPDTPFNIEQSSNALQNSSRRNIIKLTFAAAGEGGGEEPTPEPEPTPAYVEIGTGDNETMVVPVNMNSGYSYSQQLYTAQEIGIASGDITGVSFKVKSGFSGTRTVDVYMKHTEKTVFVDSYTYEKMTEDNKVFSGNFVVEANEGQWAEIVFDTPFAYEGGNFVISINDYTASNPGETYFCTDYLEEYKTLYYYPFWGGSKLDPSNMSGKGYGSYHRNIVRFALATGEGGGEEPTPEPEPTPVAPTAPASMTAIANGQNSITLTWEAGENATSYNIYSPAAGNVSGVTATEYTYNGLEAGKEYCFEITSVNEVDESIGSAYACATTEAAPVEPTPEPEQPGTNDGVVTIGDASANNTTANANYPFANVSTYSHSQQIYTPTTISAFCEQIPEGDITKIKYYIAETSQTYFSGVKVYMRNSLTSSFTSKTAWDKDFTAADLVFEGDVDVVDNAIEFVLQKSFTYDPTMNLIIYVDVDKKNGTSQTKFKTYSAAAKCALYYKNQNTNGGLDTDYLWGNSSSSAANTINVVSLTFAGEGGGEEPEPTVPAAPVVTVTQNGHKSLIFSWEPVDGATMYNIYSGTTLIAEVTETTYTVGHLQAEQTYCFSISAVTPNGETELTEACGTTEAAPVAPAIPVVTYTTTETAITLTWEAVDGAATYNIYTPQGFDEHILGLTEPTYTFEGLTAGLEYCFLVSSVSALGYESDVAEVCVTITAAPVEPEPEEPVEGVVTIGEGELTTPGLPIFTGIEYSLSQQIYLQNEIGTGAGTISSIAFKSYGGVTRDINIYMINTEKSSFGSHNKDFVALPEGSKVFDGEVTFGAGAWTTIDITPFDYTGKNLLVCVYDKTGEPDFNNYFYIYEENVPLVVGIWSYDGFIEMENGGEITGRMPNNYDYYAGLTGKNQIQLAITPIVIPAAPVVAVGTVTDATIELTWAAVDGATSYNVYVGESTEAVNVTEATYTATGLTAETEYTFVVKAVNAAGESEASNEAKATTLAPAPVAPVAPAVAVGTVTETTVELTWAAVDGADLYQIYRVNEGVEVEHDTTSLTTYTVEGLTAETEYTFVVKAINEVGYSEASNVVTATTLAAPVAPATPKNVVATANGFNSITVTWEAVDGAAKYVVYKDGEEFMSTSEYTPTTTVTIDGLEMGKQYCFAVKAVANGLESELSEPVCQSTESLPENQVLVGQATDKFYSPFLTSLGNARFEAIYKAGEIAKAGRIAEIAFSYKDGAQTSIDVNIYLAEVEKSEFANPNDFTAESDLKLVYSGTGVTICDSEWETFVLNTPFDYSGENNLLLVVSTTASSPNAINNWNCYEDPNAVLIDNGVGLYYTKKPVMMLTLAPAPVAPAAPVVAVGTVTETTVELTWAAVDGATSYNVYVGESTEAVSVTETTYTATGLTAETEYTFVVKAVNEAGESEASNVAKATTLAPAPTPVVPAAPVVAAEATGETTIVLTWAAVDGATSYNIYSADTLVANVTETTYTVKGLTADTEYTFVVKAVNADGESEASNEAKAKTNAPAPTPVVPAAPVVAAEATSDTTIVLTWAAVDGATSYNIYSADTLVANVTETTYTVKGLTADTEYTFVVKAVNAAGESEASNEAKAKTNAAAPVGPTAPAAPVVTVEVSYDTIQISWQAVEGATSYRLYYNDEMKDEFTDTIVQIQVPTIGKYCFTITAVNEIGESEHAEACAEVVVPEGMVIPAAPVLNATLEEDKVVFSWEEVEGAVYYNLYVEVKPGENQLLGVAQMDDLPIRMQLPEKGEYCFFVTAANLAGESELSERACVNYGEGIEENAAAFNIYPNPVSDKLVIETEATIEAVTIYTVTGVMVYSEVDFNNNTIDVTDFANGVYIMKVRTENGEAVQRFIKK